MLEILTFNMILLVGKELILINLLQSIWHNTATIFLNKIKNFPF